MVHKHRLLHTSQVKVFGLVVSLALAFSSFVSFKLLGFFELCIRGNPSFNSVPPGNFVECFNGVALPAI